MYGGKKRNYKLYMFPGGSVVKNPPAKQEMWVPPLGGGNPQEKEMAADSSILAWEIPWTEEPDVAPHNTVSCTTNFLYLIPAVERPRMLLFS